MCPAGKPSGFFHLKIAPAMRARLDFASPQQNGSLVQSRLSTGHAPKLLNLRKLFFTKRRDQARSAMKSCMGSVEANRLAFQVKPFCKSIGISRTKFYELVRNGKIKTIVIGGRRLVPCR